MALQRFTYSGNVYDQGIAGTTTFPLTSTEGHDIPYLAPSHIHVYLSIDDGVTWDEQVRPGEWDFDDTGTSVVLTTGISSGVWVKVQRDTPYDNRYISFAEGSLLTSGQLNEGEDFSLYVDQEIFDKADQTQVSKVTRVAGVAPIAADNTDPLNPIVSLDRITKAEAWLDPTSPSWDTDVEIATPAAIDRVYANLVGTGTSFPGAGNKGKHGKLRIDNVSDVEPSLYYWDALTSTPAWVQIKTKGDKGDKGDTGAQGPTGPAPGLQTPPTVVSNVPNKGDGTIGDATVNITQDANEDLKFTFGIPVGLKGDQGSQGIQGPIGPAPGLQSPPTAVSNVPNKGDGTVGDATVNITQNAGQDLKFTFGIPVGLKGDKGDTGATGATGPAPGLQSPPTVVSNVANNPDGSVGAATVGIDQDGNGALQFTFGIPVGEKGDEGPQGPTGAGVTYLGPVDATTDAAPGSPTNGDFFVNTATGTALASWTGITTVKTNDRLIFNSATGVWDRYEQAENLVNLDYVPTSADGTIENTGGSDAVIPGATTTEAGLLTAPDKTKLDGVEAGAEVNVQANWNQTDSGQADFIQNKPVITTTDLSYTAAPDKGTVVNSDGTDATLTTVNGTNAGLMTPTQLGKLDGIQPGAQPNVQADWNEADAGSDAFIKNKPAIGADLSYTAAPDKGTVVNSAGTDATLTLVNGTNAGLMTPTQLNKLNGIADGAEVNVQANWNETNSSSDAFIQNKPTIPDPGNPPASGDYGYWNRTGTIVEPANTGDGIRTRNGLIANGLTYPTGDGSNGQVLTTNGAGTLSWTSPTAAVNDASETVKGIVRLATAAETTTGTSNSLAVHPAGLKVETDKCLKTNISLLPLIP